VVLLQMSQRPVPCIAHESQDGYRDLVTFAYTAWQPTVAAALASAMPASQVVRLGRAAASNLERRPSALTGDEWVALGIAAHELFPNLPAAIAGAAGRLEQRQATLSKQHRSRRSRSSSFGDE
jgi:hypothetical protein